MLPGFFRVFAREILSRRIPQRKLYPFPSTLFESGPNNGTGAPPWNGSTTAALAGETHGPSRADMLSLSQADLDQLIAGGFGHGHTGYERRLRMWLSIRWTDGSTTSVVSSAANMGAGSKAGSAAPAGWQCGSGSLVAADLYGGCEVDARLETLGWTDVGYDYATVRAKAKKSACIRSGTLLLCSDATTHSVLHPLPSLQGGWADAVRIAAPGGSMAPAVFPPVRIVNELEPRAMWESPNGSYVFDLGQNFAGGVRLSLPGPTTAGTKIIVRHAEAVMHPPYGAQVSKRPLS